MPSPYAKRVKLASLQQGLPWRRTARIHGMTLAELILALGLLAIMVVCMTGLFSNLLGSATKGSHLTAGSFFARQRLEEVLRKDLYWPVPPAAAQGIYTTDKDSQTTFFYRVMGTPIPPVAGQYRAAYWIDVEVWWWSEAPGQNRSGQGKLYTSIGRMHYPPGALQ